MGLRRAIERRAEDRERDDELTALRRTDAVHRQALEDLGDEVDDRTRQLKELQAAFAEQQPATDGDADGQVPEPARHLMFVPTAAGYVLVERESPPPLRGSSVTVPEAGDAAFHVTKIARSPLPFDARPCAYLQPRF